MVEVVKEVVKEVKASRGPGGALHGGRFTRVSGHSVNLGINLRPCGSNHPNNPNQNLLSLSLCLSVSLRTRPRSSLRVFLFFLLSFFFFFNTASLVCVSIKRAGKTAAPTWQFPIFRVLIRPGSLR